MIRVNLMVIAVSLAVQSAFLYAQERSEQTTVTAALRSGDRTAAIKAVESSLAANPAAPRVIMMAADTYLRCGKPELALPLYDQYIEFFPESMPQLWQRGIALYFLGQHTKATEQFVEHRKVNPHDVENAAWHFVCLAKAESFEKANQSVLPAPNDPRIPMAQVQQMLKSGDVTVVTKRMDQISKDEPEYASAMFYGNFYLGLYADAKGDRATAIEKMALAAKDAPHHYMGDVCRVYAEYLDKTE